VNKDVYKNNNGNISTPVQPALQTSVPKTIRKTPLTKAQTAVRKKIKYGEKRFSIWRMQFFRHAMWYVALGWHATKFAQTFAILEFYFWFQFRPYHGSRHVIRTSVRYLSKSDYPWQKKVTSCRFSRWRISAISDFRSPVMGSLKTSCTTF